MSVTDDDRWLIERLATARDQRAFSMLYERHTTQLYRLALRLTAGDAAAAADIVHDAWVAAVPRLTEFQWRSSLGTWLSGFVVNMARARFREERRDVDIDDHMLATDDSELTGVFARVDIERALAALPSGYRAVLVLHDVQGHTHDEVAGMLGISAGGSKSQLSRARAAMRRLLNPEEGRNV